MAHTHRFSVSVAGAVVATDGSMLAIKRQDNGHWEPPGGVLEPGETMQEGLIREVWEETGVEVTIDRLSGVYQNLERDIISVVFRCSALAGSLRGSNETAQVRWLTSDEIRDLMTPAYAVRLLDASENGAPSARSHDGVNLA